MNRDQTRPATAAERRMALIDSAGIRILRSEIVIPRLLDEVFAFFSDAFNLERITPPFLRFRVLTRPPIEMHPGTLLDYRLRLHGIPLHWQSEISTWEPPYRFVDRQRKGPYRLWEHEHAFEQTPGGVLMRDCVRYVVPGGYWLGGLLHRLYVGRSVRRIFEYRSLALARIFGMDAAAARGRITQS